MSATRIVITGSDTGIGKTIFAAALVQAIGASYWKAIQAGLDGETDSQTVARLAGLPQYRILPEAYRLTLPRSPHFAAEQDNVFIDLAALDLPDCAGPLVVEGAGGVLVPIRRDLVFADLFARWNAPVVLVARTTLGTINHSLLSIEALRARGVPIIGIAFVGEAQDDSEATIAALGKVRRLGRLPPLAPLDSTTLAGAFAEHFRIEDFGI